MQQIQEKSFDEPRSLIMPSLASVIAAAAEGKCDDEYIQELIQACSGELPTPKNMIHYAFEVTVDNLKLELQKLKYMLSNLGINGFVIPVLDAKLKPIKGIRVGEGTVAKLCVDLSGYSVAGKTGVSAKLRLVQIIDLVEYVGGATADAYGLTEEDGFDFEDDEDVTTEDASEDGEEELDF